MASVAETPFVSGTTPENTRLDSIPLSKIVESEVALRSVNRSSEKYLGLVESIRKCGVLGPILVRELVDAAGVVSYGLVDGLHRFTAAKDAGLVFIPANVRNMDDQELMNAQIIANLHKIETKPAEYSKQLIRVLSANPLMTVGELAQKLSVQKGWLSDRLSLVKLAESIQELVDSNQIGLANAYALAKLPEEEQVDYVDRAMTDSPNEFVPVVSARVKELRDAKHQGRDASPAEFVASARIRKLSELKNEQEVPAVAETVLTDLGIEASATAIAAFKAALTWALQLDPRTVELKKLKEQERRKMVEEQKVKNKAEREKRKAEEAAAKQASLSSL